MKQEGVVVQGCEVIEELGCGNFKVKLPNDHIVLAYISGKMRQKSIKAILGDKVDVEFCPYDLTKGRIIFREKVTRRY